MKKTIIEALHNSGLIPVFYYPDLETCISVINACYKGGIRVIEFLNRGEGAIANFPELKQHIQESCRGMILGIGSTMDKKQAEVFIKLGADFIVSPVLSEEIALACNEHNIYWIPGCSTPTEIAKAKSYGADIIKVFPGEVLGPGFIKAVLGPMPDLKLMPTGGVEPSEKNLKTWFDAGAVCVGMGSKLFSRELIADPSLLEEKIKKTIEIIHRLKQ